MESTDCQPLLDGSTGEVAADRKHPIHRLIVKRVVLRPTFHSVQPIHWERLHPLADQVPFPLLWAERAFWATTLSLLNLIFAEHSVPEQDSDKSWPARSCRHHSSPWFARLTPFESDRFNFCGGQRLVICRSQHPSIRYVSDYFPMAKFTNSFNPNVLPSPMVGFHFGSWARNDRLS